jgi:two-component system chemotaxis response regulator CheY
MSKILVVDDAAFMRLRLAKLLAENNHEVLEAGNGVEALRVYQTKKPDAVFLDITMPEMDGIQTLIELRKIDPKAKIAMLTAIGNQSVVIQALKLGAKDYVIKPFDADRVLTSLRRLLG